MKEEEEENANRARNEEYAKGCKDEEGRKRIPQSNDDGGRIKMFNNTLIPPGGNLDSINWSESITRRLSIRQKAAILAEKKIH
ncbi:hypothetical protein DMENIID0001_060800 [Sergentomyia squamirostris]